MLEGKLIITPALGQGKSSLTGSGLFVLMSQWGNNNELTLQHGGFCTIIFMASNFSMIPITWLLTVDSEMAFLVF